MNTKEDYLVFLMNVVAMTNPIALTLWAIAYLLCVSCFLIKRKTFIFALSSGIMTITAIIVTLILGGTLLEIGSELLLLVLLCLIGRGSKA